MGLLVAIILLAIFFAIFGFGGFISAFTTIAVILFWIFVAVLVISLLLRLVRGAWWWG